MSITATHRREFSSPSQKFDAPECPAKWLVLHRAATVKHRENKRLHVIAQDVGKRTNHSHGKHSLNAMCNHVEQPWTPTATQQPTCDGRQRPYQHTSHTLSQSNAHPHSCNATCETELENKKRPHNKTRNMAHLGTRTTLTSRHLHVAFRNSTTELF